jgi:hypothetical protein
MLYFFIGLVLLFYGLSKQSERKNKKLEYDEFEPLTFAKAKPPEPPQPLILIKERIIEKEVRVIDADFREVNPEAIVRK